MRKEMRLTAVCRSVGRKGREGEKKEEKGRDRGREAPLYLSGSEERVVTLAVCGPRHLARLVPLVLFASF